MPSIDANATKLYDPLAVSLTLPVSMKRLGINGDSGAPDCPPFLLDLVPQGRGRKLLAAELDISDREENDLLLTQYGAFNPVGNLRLDTAGRRSMTLRRCIWIES